MTWKTLLSVGAASALFATAASAAPQRITFSGTIINDTSLAQTSYVADYVYDPSQGTVTLSITHNGLNARVAEEAGLLLRNPV